MILAWASPFNIFFTTKVSHGSTQPFSLCIKAISEIFDIIVLAEYFEVLKYAIKVVVILQFTGPSGQTCILK